MTSQNKALNTQEVAKMLNVSKNTIYELIRRGEINSYRVGRKVRFTQEEVDAYIGRSHHVQSVAPARKVSVQSSLLYGEKTHTSEFIISGQDVIIDILSNYLRQYGINALRAYVGSFESLLSLYEDNVQVATSHLWDSDSNTYNSAYVRRLMPGTHAVIINLSYRMQGFYVQEGNPKNINSWEDLIRDDITIINRRKGSGSRILLDEHIMKMGISGRDIRGYSQEMSSHLTLANAITRGEADIGIGTERITVNMEGLKFIPIQKERYDLIVKKEAMDTIEINTILKVLCSKEFRNEISSISGNDYTDMGKIMEEI